MPGLGTLINVAGIVIGGMAGLLFGKLIKPRMQETMTCACGVCVIFLGIAGAMEKMLTANENGALSSGGTMMVIASLVLGALVGELLNIEAGMERFGGWLKKVTHSEGDGGFVDGFVTASLTVCIGAMAVVGAIQDGILGDYSTLAAKAVLDLIIVMIMTSAKGKGCIFSAIPVAVFQGVITALSRLIEPVMTEKALANLSLVGSILIFCVGVNLVWGKKIKVANFLPGIVFAVACAFLPWF
ncbi:MAG: DUF554 domain-containing protein [Oscillospiraceae bacterium]|nr:DUF554 domain-containing protein [Oscillospiraceae bacterium]